MAVLGANINRSRQYEDIVQLLASQKLPGADRPLFPTIRELLCFAALLGYSEGRRVPLDRSQGVEDVSYQQFERGDAVGVPAQDNPSRLADREAPISPSRD